MSRFAGVIVANAVLGLLVAATAIRADEEKIDLDKLPKAVLEAVKAKFPDAKLTAASKEKEGDKTIYEVAFTFKDHKYEAELTAEGAFLTVEKRIDAKDLPKEVAKALEEKYPKATYKVIEEVTKDGKITAYEVELTTADNKSFEVVLDPAGKVLNEPKQDEEKKAAPAPPAVTVEPEFYPERRQRRLLGLFGHLLRRNR